MVLIDYLNKRTQKAFNIYLNKIVGTKPQKVFKRKKQKGLQEKAT